MPPSYLQVSFELEAKHRLYVNFQSIYMSSILAVSREGGFEQAYLLLCAIPAIALFPGAV